MTHEGHKRQYAAVEHPTPSCHRRLGVQMLGCLSGSAEVRPCVVGLGRRPFQVIARSVKKHLSTSLMMASHQSACICPEESRKHLLNDFQFAAVDAWYARRASVRNLWVIEERYRLRILVTLEPAPDDSDTSPAWIANCHAWVDEL